MCHVHAVRLLLLMVTISLLMPMAVKQMCFQGQLPKIRQQTPPGKSQPVVKEMRRLVKETQQLAVMTPRR
jgi:hypothetical protein